MGSIKNCCLIYRKNGVMNGSLLTILSGRRDTRVGCGSSGIQLVSDWMEEAAEQQHFEASLNCIPNAFRRPWMSYMSYKDFLKPKAQHHFTDDLCPDGDCTGQFLMYSARALLNHPPHLQLFLNMPICSSVTGTTERHCSPQSGRAGTGSGYPCTGFYLACPSYVAKMTFQSPKTITRYFSTMLLHRMTGRQSNCRM